MPSKMIYVADNDAALYEQADARAKAEGKSLSAVVSDLLRGWLAEAQQARVQLYYTDALPEHYVAIKPDGSRWIIACSPMGPEAWQGARSYRGNHILERVCPTAIERFYQPQE